MFFCFLFFFLAVGPSAIVLFYELYSSFYLDNTFEFHMLIQFYFLILPHFYIFELLTSSCEYCALMYVFFPRNISFFQLFYFLISLWHLNRYTAPPSLMLFSWCQITMPFIWKLLMQKRSFILISAKKEYSTNRFPNKLEVE